MALFCLGPLTMTRSGVNGTETDRRGESEGVGALDRMTGRHAGTGALVSNLIDGPVDEERGLWVDARMISLVIILSVIKQLLHGEKLILFWCCGSSAQNVYFHGISFYYLIIQFCTPCTKAL